MGEIRMKLKYFTISDCEKEENYLREQHKNGWKFKKVIFPNMYFFERCKPEDVVYQLDYNKNRLNESAEYKKMFEDSGWEYITDFVGFSYFRKPVSEMNGEERIYSDAASVSDMYRRIWFARIPILITIMGVVIIPELVFQFLREASYKNGFLIMFMVLFLLYICIISKFTYECRQIKKQCR